MVQYLQILLNARVAKMEERGATAVEYGLLVALIAGAIILIVTLLGTDGDERIVAQELADLMGTITYEVTCLVAPRVPRVYVEG